MRTLFTLTALALAPAAFAGDWPQFRGANGLGAAEDKNLPTEWSKDKGLRWKVDSPSRGLSGPVIVGDRVYVTCSSGTRDDRLHILAFDVKSGKELWHRQLAATGSTACHPKTCMAAPTPAADAQGVYALFATGDLAAFDRDGNLRWYRSLVGDYPSVSNQVGMAASLAITGDKLIVPMDNAGDSFLAAIDTKTGKNLWKIERPRDINWTTPIIRKSGDATEVLFMSPKGLFAYDVATGKERWTFKQGGGAIPSPTVAGEMLFLPTSGVTAVKLTPSGAASEAAWKGTGLTTKNASPLVYEGRVYTVNETGVVSCADAESGKVIWKDRLKGVFSATPIAGDNKLYLVDEAGTTTVIRTDSESMDVLGTNALGEEVLGTPAIADGALFIRTGKSLVCVGKK